MSDASEVAIATLKGRIADLENQIAKSNRDHAAYRHRYKDLLAKHEPLKAELEGLRQSHAALADSLKDVETVMADNERLAGLVDEYAPKVNDAARFQADLEALRDEKTALANQVADLRAKLALPPDEANQRLADYQARYRRLRHEGAFREALKDFTAAGPDGTPRKYKLNQGATIENVWRESDYAPDADEADGAKASEALRAALTRAPYLFAPAETAPTGPGGPPPGPGASRGAPLFTGGDFVITRAQARSSKFMAQHEEAIREASRSGRFRIVD